MRSLAQPVFAMADDRHVNAMMQVMQASFDPLWGEAWTESQLASGMTLQGSFARRALDARGETLGFALCRGVAMAMGGEVELLLIAVTPLARGRGLGRALLDQVKADSRLRGMAEMFLEVRASNVAAIRLYHMSGFSEVGRRRDYYVGVDGNRHDAITMRCLVLS